MNSALQRARETLDQRRREGRLELGRGAASDAAERSLLKRFVEAWEAMDVERLVGLLTEDAVLTMPPMPLRFEGHGPIAQFFSTVPAGGDLTRLRLVPARANLQPALVAYLLDDTDGRYRAYGIMVVTIDGDAIAEIVGFSDPLIFPIFGLPAELA